MPTGGDRAPSGTPAPTFCVDRPTCRDGEHLVHQLLDPPAQCQPPWSDQLFPGAQASDEAAMAAALHSYRQVTLCPCCTAAAA